MPFVSLSGKSSCAREALLYQEGVAFVRRRCCVRKALLSEKKLSGVLVTADLSAVEEWLFLISRESVSCSLPPLVLAVRPLAELSH